MNLTKIESRPLLDGSFDVMFYLDFTGSIISTDPLKFIHLKSHSIFERADDIRPYDKLKRVFL